VLIGLQKKNRPLQHSTRACTLLRLRTSRGVSDSSSPPEAANLARMGPSTSSGQKSKLVNQLCSDAVHRSRARLVLAQILGQNSATRKLGVEFGAETNLLQAFLPKVTPLRRLANEGHVVFARAQQRVETAPEHWLVGEEEQTSSLVSELSCGARKKTNNVANLRWDSTARVQCSSRLSKTQSRLSALVQSRLRINWCVCAVRGNTSSEAVSSADTKTSGCKLRSLLTRGALCSHLCVSAVWYSSTAAAT
jgi:hypothetical protein